MVPNLLDKPKTNGDIQVDDSESMLNTKNLTASHPSSPPLEGQFQIEMPSLLLARTTQPCCAVSPIDDQFPTALIEEFDGELSALRSNPKRHSPVQSWNRTSPKENTSNVGWASGNSWPPSLISSGAQ